MGQVSLGNPQRQEGAALEQLGEWRWAPGGHPQCPGGPQGSHGCGAGPTCCVCFHSAEAVATTSLVVASRPCYIMSSAPRSPRQRVFPFPLPSVVPAHLAFAAQPRTRTWTQGGAGQRRCSCSRLTGSGEGGPSSSGVPRWGATCKRHTWSGDVRPAEGPTPAPPRRDLGEAGLTHRTRLPPFPVRLPGFPLLPITKAE